MSRYELELKRVFYVKAFDDIKKRRAIIAQMPEYDKYQERLSQVESLRNSGHYDDILRPTFETPLLTPKQEFHLFRLMNYYKYRAKKALERGRSAKAFIVKARAIRNQLTEANVRLAPKAIKYNSYDGARDEDLLEAYMAVMKAVDYFDYRKGYKFSTYCTWVIKRNSTKLYYQNLKNAMTHSFDFEVLEAEKHEKPTPLGVMRKTIRAILAKLNVREAFILRSRYGIDCDPLTLKQIGKKLRISKERVRQLEARLMEKIKENQPIMKKVSRLLEI
jgi:RNA polymerase sigma factor (sigma-70 family)